MNERSKLPGFTKDGVLPVGDYELTPDELRSSKLVLGPKRVRRIRRWDATHRAWLLENAIAMVMQLWQVGIKDVFIGGSFVEDVDYPNDIDGYFNCDEQAIQSGTLQRQLNGIEARKIWTWDPSSRQRVPGSYLRRLPMWRAYRVELFPNYGQSAGIVDRFGNTLDFPAAFRFSRRGVPKGIIKVVAEHDSNRR